MFPASNVPASPSDEELDGLRPTSLGRALRSSASTSTMEDVQRGFPTSLRTSFDFPTEERDDVLYRAISAAPALVRDNRMMGDTEVSPFEHQFLGSKASIVSSSSSSSTSQQLLQPPTVPGGFLEPNFHVFTTCGATQVLAQLQEISREMNVQFAVIEDSFKLRCVSVCPLSQCATPFVVRLFALDATTAARNKVTPAAFAIEWQRRCGDSMAFGLLFRRMVRELAVRGSVDMSSSTVQKAMTMAIADDSRMRDISTACSSSSSLDPLAPLARLGSMQQRQEPTSTSATASQPGAADVALESLLSMLNAENATDVNAEAARAIACMPAAALCAPKTVRSLVKSAQSDAADLKRCSAAALATVTSAGPESTRVVLDAAGVGANELVALALSSCTFTRRSLAEVLMSLARVGGRTAIGPELRSAIGGPGGLSSSPDGPTRDYASACLAALQ